MFLIDILDLFSQLTILRYIFVAFGFYGLMLCLQFIILRSWRKKKR